MIRHMNKALIDFYIIYSKLKIFSKFSNAVKGNFQYAQKINLLATFIDMAETSEDRAEFGLPGLDQFIFFIIKNL